MTSTVTVKTHDREVEVSRIHSETGEPLAPVETVPAGAQIMFTVHGTNALAIREKQND